jgi:hypothetical protein
VGSCSKLPSIRLYIIFFDAINQSHHSKKLLKSSHDCFSFQVYTTSSSRLIPSPRPNAFVQMKVVRSIHCCCPKPVVTKRRLSKNMSVLSHRRWYHIIYHPLGQQDSHQKAESNCTYRTKTYFPQVQLPAAHVQSPPQSQLEFPQPGILSFLKEK